MSPREMSGLANYLGYMNKMGLVPHWDELPTETKEAWIAGAYEALWLQWTIETNKGPGPETA